MELRFCPWLLLVIYLTCRTDQSHFFLIPVCVFLVMANSILPSIHCKNTGPQYQGVELSFQHRFTNKVRVFRQCYYCINSTSERYSLKGHLKVRRFFAVIVNYKKRTREHRRGRATQGQPLIKEPRAVHTQLYDSNVKKAYHFELSIASRFSL